MEYRQERSHIRPSGRRRGDDLRRLRVPVAQRLGDIRRPGREPLEVDVGDGNQRAINGRDPQTHPIDADDVGTWQDEYAETVVLRPPPESNTVAWRDETCNYMKNPYACYDDARQIGSGGEFDDDRFHPKAQVIGISHDGVAHAYPLEVI